MFGVCYYPEHWPEKMWADDAAEMKKLGIEWVRIGDFSWSRIEPIAGQYDFAWMDRAIDTLAEAGLKIIICTPTATPPKWLIDLHPDILPVDIKTGQTRGFGSRRHYDFSSDIYVEAAMKITEVMVKRYGTNHKVSGWQTDNEIGCHDTTQSGSANAKAKFQVWLKNKYKTIEALNEAWGTVFWSMEYNDFEQVELPLYGVTEMGLSHQLDYRRFSSDMAIAFHDKMVNTIREHCKNQFVTHNMIPMCDTQIDNFKLTKDLDFVAYDSYPLGRNAEVLNPSSFEHMRTGHPDLNAYFIEQTRGLSPTGRFWIMEQQPGVVNWANYNPMPAKGMVRLWTWEAFAHGAECVSFFRWRQLPFGQEQMHAGIKMVNNQPSLFYNEIAATISEVAKHPELLSAKVDNKVALVTGTENQWFCEIETQSTLYKHLQTEFQYYRVLQQLGIGVDFIDETSDISQYQLIICPASIAPSDDFCKKVTSTNAHFVLGPRFASKTKNLHLPHNMPPGVFAEQLGYTVMTADTTPVSHQHNIHYNGKTYTSHTWRDIIQLHHNSPLKITAKIEGLKKAAMLQNDRFTVITSLTDDKFLVDVFKEIAAKLDLPLNETFGDIRFKQKGNYLFVLNYSNQPYQLDCFESEQYVLGSKLIPAHDLAIIKTSEFEEQL
ncbi:beta-galactosidase [Catenovulum agarivorans DS-2]|uniref:Beta-galactosidase n=1 Tax=Catenovulum agarivorans DS-2 TaxID=1328313 RepID=W7QMN8_9ALTE|nr:beta-galactosidase [Catenovulum agarivorans]EWH10212.1 beta-galactosidase [Catenovulum agarivorans DS-2]